MPTSNAPFNAPRHEPLVKRLFKFADGAGDDATMARFLVGLDRSVRRQIVTRRKWNSRARDWDESSVVVTLPDTTLPKDERFLTGACSSRIATNTRRAGFCSPSPPETTCGGERGGNFAASVGSPPSDISRRFSVALKLYTDTDTADGLGLLDNWGWSTSCFTHSPTLEARPIGWRVATGGSLARLQPDPMFRKLWLNSPEPVFDLLTGAGVGWSASGRSRCSSDTSRSARASHPGRIARLAGISPLRPQRPRGRVDRECAGARNHPRCAVAEVDRDSSPEALDRICALIQRLVKPDHVSFADAVRLAMARPIPLARLGQAFLVAKRPTTPNEVRAVFGLRDAEAEPIRPMLVKWACEVLGGLAEFQPLWVLEFLDNRHQDVREAGWVWLQTDERARESAIVWQRLFESPYDDIRVRLWRCWRPVAEPGALDAFSPALVRFLWASVLLNIHRGGRAKPYVVRQIMDRLGHQPGEAADLLPIVAVALRSVRGPEFRAGLAGLAGFVTRHPNTEILWMSASRN